MESESLRQISSALTRIREIQQRREARFLARIQQLEEENSTLRLQLQNTRRRNSVRLSSTLKPTSPRESLQSLAELDFKNKEIITLSLLADRPTALSYTKATGVFTVQFASYTRSVVLTDPNDKQKMLFWCGLSSTTVKIN